MPNEKKYIDAETFADYCCRQCIKRDVSCNPTTEACDYIEDLQSFLCDMTAADVAEVKHGRWKLGNVGLFGYSMYCSLCGEVEDEETDYCPNCGARMDGDI